MALRTLSRDWRRRAKRLADKLGISPELQRKINDRLRPDGKRDRVDNEHLALLMSFILKDDSNCIEVGAHDGEMLDEIVRLSPRGRHLAYEPLPHLFEALERNYPNVDCRQAALSDESGEASFTYVSTDPGYSGFRPRTYEGEQVTEQITVKTERLDDVLDKHYVPAFIKIDVEGAELQVLRGARETIIRHKPVIVFEHGKGSSDHYGTRASDVYELLVGEAGLRIFDFDGTGPYSAAQFDEVFDQPIWNFVAH